MLLRAVVPGIGRTAELVEIVEQELIETVSGHFEYFEPSLSVVIVAAEGHFEQLVGLETVEAVGAVARRDWRN